MRPLLTIPCFILLFTQALQAQRRDTITTTGTITINNVAFTWVKAKPADDSLQQEVFELYHDHKKMLTHTLMDKESDCNSISLELGDIASTDSTITFYSYWAWVGGCCGMPYGARKQVYRVTAGGQLLPFESSIFLEKYKTRLAELAENEVTAFKAKIEKEYNAKFVTGSAATDLLAETKRRFTKQIAAQTKGWEKNRYGFRR